jgi:hypothetical protein
MSTTSRQSPRDSFPLWFRVGVRVRLVRPLPLGTRLDVAAVPRGARGALLRAIVSIIDDVEHGELCWARRTVHFLSSEILREDGIRPLWRWYLLDVSDVARDRLRVGDLGAVLEVLVPLAGPLLVGFERAGPRPGSPAGGGTERRSVSNPRGARRGRRRRQG